MDGFGKLEVVDRIMKLGERNGATPKGILTFLGDEKTYLKQVSELFPSFSWAGRGAVRMALIVNEAGRNSSRGRAATLELLKEIPYLRGTEVLATFMALEQGKGALLEFSESLKSMKIGTRLCSIL